MVQYDASTYVWYGMVWYGMPWCSNTTAPYMFGMVWYGMVCHGGPIRRLHMFPTEPRQSSVRLDISVTAPAMPTVGIGITVGIRIQDRPMFCVLMVGFFGPNDPSLLFSYDMKEFFLCFIPHTYCTVGKRFSSSFQIREPWETPTTGSEYMFLGKFLSNFS